MIFRSWTTRLNREYLSTKAVLGTYFSGIRSISMRHVFGALLASTFIIIPVSSNAAFIDNATGPLARHNSYVFGSFLGVRVIGDRPVFRARSGVWKFDAQCGLVLHSHGQSRCWTRELLPMTTTHSISFNTAITEAAFMMVTNGYTDTFRALLTEL